MLLSIYICSQFHNTHCDVKFLDFCCLPAECFRLLVSMLLSKVTTRCVVDIEADLLPTAECLSTAYSTLSSNVACRVECTVVDFALGQTSAYITNP